MTKRSSFARGALMETSGLTSHQPGASSGLHSVMMKTTIGRGADMTKGGGTHTGATS